MSIKTTEEKWTVLIKHAGEAEQWQEMVLMPARVLMVDDTISVRDVLRHHLECIGCEVIAEAGSTLQALDLFRTVRPSLVTFDIGVAQTGGITPLYLFRMMRAEKPRVAILVVSSVAAADVCQSFLEEGALDYLVTPFDTLSFERVRQRVLGLFPELTPMRFNVRAPQRH